MSQREYVPAESSPSMIPTDFTATIKRTDKGKLKSFIDGKL